MQTRHSDSHNRSYLTDPLAYVAFAVIVILPMLIFLSACARTAAQPADPARRR
jgi:hypothetical protein